MKKMFLIALTVIFACTSIMAQENNEKEEKKKDGGFMKKVKKGIESNTGLKVSDETLFVYPTIGDWKMSLESCTGDKQSGEVLLKIKVTKISEGQYMASVCLLTEAIVTGTKNPLLLERFSADPLYNFQPNKTIDVTFQRIEVPVEAQSLDVKFFINYRDLAFEARRVPIEWN